MTSSAGKPAGAATRNGANGAPRGPRREGRRPERFDALRVALFLGGSLFVIAAFLFTSLMVTRLSEEVATTSRVLARFLAQASFPATRDPQLQEILAQVVAGIDFPIVITDIDSLPRAWRQIGIDTGLVPAASIDSVANSLAVAPVIAERIRAVRAHAANLDRRNRPIEMRQPVTNVRLGYVHYGVPPVLDALQWIPFLSVAGMLLLLAIGFWGFSGVRTAEGRSIWVGMARETAHQLGTPLSSLMGWIELLRSHAESQPGDNVNVPRAELDETLTEMERDVARLNKVAQRFSHVGSTPVLQLQDVTPIVRQAVQYARRRLPRGDGDVSIQEIYEEVEPINLNAELLEWAVENLLSNAVSALDKRPARIDVTIRKRPETEAIELSIVDNGRGMTPAEQRRAFEPGYTTKRRGWGLGLALTRRVVEEYHGGRISIRDSVPGVGTSMVITFPT